MCRVRLLARPRPRAAIRAELWLPPPKRWSGRYYQMGNGGFAGTIFSAALSAAAERGDAAAATDTGHQGDGFDAHWAMRRPDLVADYGWRSIGVTSTAARRLIVRYYGHPPRYRYYMGCSNGGRQALVAASRWPKEWDGVIAGAPAVDWVGTFARFGAIQHAARIAPGGLIDPARLPALLATAGRICSAQGEPCGHALARACQAGDASACLAPAQARTLRIIEQAGYPPARADAAEWSQWIFPPTTAAPSQAAFAIQAFRFIFNDRPTWTIAEYRPVAGATKAKLAAALEPRDLGPFLRGGGKVLSYFGWADPVLPPLGALRYQRALSAGRPLPGYQLFMVSGMAHCQGGVGPTAFGQSAEAPSIADDAEHDIRRALEAWVEQGRMPRSLIAGGGGNAATQILEPTEVR